MLQSSFVSYPSNYSLLWGNRPLSPVTLHYMCIVWYIKSCIGFRRFLYHLREKQMSNQVCSSGKSFVWGPFSLPSVTHTQSSKVLQDLSLQDLPYHTQLVRLLTSMYCSDLDWESHCARHNRSADSCANSFQLCSHVKILFQPWQHHELL